MKGERTLAKIIKYKGDQILFNEFQNLKWRVQGLAAIVQNPEMEVTEELYDEWIERADEVKKELDRIITLATITVEGGEIIEQE
jgi:hypothetical protein